jgi:hypothetical protein
MVKLAVPSLRLRFRQRQDSVEIIGDEEGGQSVEPVLVVLETRSIE